VPISRTAIQRRVVSGVLEFPIRPIPLLASQVSAAKATAAITALRINLFFIVSIMSFPYLLHHHCLPDQTHSRLPISAGTPGIGVFLQS